jgi:hypothetical protein
MSLDEEGWVEDEKGGLGERHVAGESGIVETSFKIRAKAFGIVIQPADQLGYNSLLCS